MNINAIKIRLVLYAALIISAGGFLSYVSGSAAPLALLSAAAALAYFMFAGQIAKKREETAKNIGALGETIETLRADFDNLRGEKDKLGYILNNIGDGIFVADENKSIALINAAAREIFNVTPDIINKNINYLSNNKTLADAVVQCADSAKSAIFEIFISGGIYSVTVKRLPGAKLTMAALSDVTESRENAKRREEFFANASHELKTPLTAIKGFNELTALNNKAEGLNKYINGIERETGRMLSLIGDMLKLSELESARGLNPVPVSLARIADEAREATAVAAAEKSISFNIDGDAAIMAEPEHIYELVKNLIENAVRYNYQNGGVAVVITPARLVITDTGIGVSPDDQSRIFERFYRVEKSRSQKNGNGGTGLGLAIVKHICALYGWRLSLKSRPGAGTEITVEFGA